eukprot:118577-Amphidinium_carterae.2
MLSRGRWAEAHCKRHSTCCNTDARQRTGVIRSIIDKEMRGDTPGWQPRATLQANWHVALDETPLGVGSVAQVHRCGKHAVKVSLATRQSQMQKQAETLKRLAKDEILCKTPIANVARLVEGSMSGFMEEFVMRKEAETLIEVSSRFQGMATEGGAAVRLPEVLGRSEWLMVMSFEEGRRYKDVAPQEQLKCLRTLLEFCGRCLFELGIAYGDPHPGNLLVNSSKNELVVPDWGMVSRLSEQQVASLRTIFLHLPMGTEEQVEQALASSASVIAKEMRSLGYDTEKSTDEGLAWLALHIFDSTRPPVLEAMKTKLVRHKRDPPQAEKVFPPAMAPVMRLRAMLGGMVTKLNKDAASVDALVQLNTLTAWKPLAGSYRA